MLQNIYLFLTLTIFGSIGTINSLENLLTSIEKNQLSSNSGKLLDLIKPNQVSIRLRREEFQFKSYSLNGVKNDLELSLIGPKSRLPVEVYISDNNFLQITSSLNKNLWSSLPYSIETLEALSTHFEIISLSISSSSLKASSSPSTLRSLKLENTMITEGTLSSILKRNSFLLRLHLNNSGDIYISDLISTRLRSINTQKINVNYGPNVKLPLVEELRFYEGSNVDQRILAQISTIFPNLESIGLDQNQYESAKRSLEECKKLNWIRIWKVNKAQLREELEWDRKIVESGFEFKSSTPVEIVKYKNEWNVMSF